MRKLYLKNKWEVLGAKFTEINGAEAVSSVNSFDAEYSGIRKTAVFCDFSFCRRFVFDEGEALDFLDEALAENILKLRYGKIINTFLATPEGEIAAECFVANVADKVYLIAESIAEDSYLDGLILKCPSAKDISGETVLLGVDGPEAWRVAKDIFGQDVLNIPYLGVENYEFEGAQVRLLRNGKTSEFGYQFLAPISVAEKLFAAIEKSMLAINGVFAGTDINFNARLEGNFFNIYAEGKVVKDPISLGIQWMIDVEKESFIGSEAIFKRREEGCDKTLVGVKSLNANHVFNIGDEIFLEGKPLAKIVAAGKSNILDSSIGLAIFDKNYGMSGFEFSTKAAGDLDLLTISMPPIIALSLQNGLDY